MVGGPDHLFEYINPALMALIGGRGVPGQPVVECLPELVEQGFIAILDGVLRTGEPFIGNDEVASTTEKQNGFLGPGSLLKCFDKLSLSGWLQEGCRKAAETEGGVRRECLVAAQDHAG